MRRVVHFYRSSVGKKLFMAVSGIILFLWVVAHMIGNLKAFQGRETLNAYAEGLRTVGEPFFGHGQLLWLARSILLACVALHIVAATQLTLLSRAARPVGYQRAPHLELSYASRTMRWGGVIIFLYVLYHLMHFTWGTLHPDFIPGDVYHNLVTGFRAWPVAAIYFLAMAALGLHLYHGVWSALQTLGVNHPRYNPYRRVGAALVAALVFAGFVSVPAAVLTGVLR
jgi:succinate dehydrogenase / fumarate reductase cytochrome b subunit